MQFPTLFNDYFGFAGTKITIFCWRTAMCRRIIWKYYMFLHSIPLSSSYYNLKWKHVFFSLFNYDLNIRDFPTIYNLYIYVCYLPYVDFILAFLVNVNVFACISTTLYTYEIFQTSVFQKWQISTGYNSTWVYISTHAVYTHV